MSNHLNEVLQKLNNEDYEIENFKIIESEKFSEHGHVIAKSTEVVLSLKSSKNKKVGVVAGLVAAVMGVVGYANDAVGFISDVLPLLTG